MKEFVCADAAGVPQAHDVVALQKAEQGLQAHRRQVRLCGKDVEREGDLEPARRRQPPEQLGQFIELAGSQSAGDLADVVLDDARPSAQAVAVGIDVERQRRPGVQPGRSLRPQPATDDLQKGQAELADGAAAVCAPWAQVGDDGVHQCRRVVQPVGCGGRDDCLVCAACVQMSQMKCGTEQGQDVVAKAGV